jgi:hypothetical protein
VDSSADTAAWVAAIAAVASLVFIAWQILGARSERVRQHDIESLERMLAIVTDATMMRSAGWNPALFFGLWVSLSDRAKDLIPRFSSLDVTSATMKPVLIDNAGPIANELLIAIRTRVGLNSLARSTDR